MGKYMIKADDIRKMSPEERLKKLNELREELMKLSNPGKIRAIRKTIARILTIMREEELKKQRGEKKS